MHRSKTIITIRCISAAEVLHYERAGKTPCCSGVTDRAPWVGQMMAMHMDTLS